MKRICLTLLFFIFFANHVFAYQNENYPFTSVQDENRFATLTKEIRCVVCQNQNIAESTAPLALDLRKKVYEMVLAKKTDDEIKDFFVERYGEFILLDPRLTEVTLFLWGFPLLGLLVIGFILARTFKIKDMLR